MDIQELIKHDGVVFIVRKTGIPGLYSLFACHLDWSHPVGTLFFSHCGESITVLSYVFIDSRCLRCGVGTSLVHELKRLRPRRDIITSEGSDVGTPWLESMGFVKESPFGWILRADGK